MWKGPSHFESERRPVVDLQVKDQRMTSKHSHHHSGVVLLQRPCSPQGESLAWLLAWMLAWLLAWMLAWMLAWVLAWLLGCVADCRFSSTLGLSSSSRGVTREESFR